MTWNPQDITRLVALIGGFLLCMLGGVLMWLGVGADGTVDIKSSVLSGTVKTGSAGLFTLFFGFGIIIFVIASLAAREGNKQLSPTQRRSRTQHIVRAFWGVLVAFVCMSAAASLGYGAGFVGASIFLGVLLFFTGIAYVVQLDYE